MVSSDDPTQCLVGTGHGVGLNRKSNKTEEKNRIKSLKAKADVIGFTMCVPHRSRAKAFGFVLTGFPD